MHDSDMSERSVMAEAKPLRIGLYGSARDTNARQEADAVAIGQALAHHGCILVTGACSGLPELAAQAAHLAGAMVWGYSPAADIIGQQQFQPEQSLELYSHLEFVPDALTGSNVEVGKKIRNVLSTASVDGAIVMAGRWGTLHEVCSLADFSIPTGILTGRGGIADELQELSMRIDGTEHLFLFDSDCEQLVERVLDAAMLRRKKYGPKG